MSRVCLLTGASGTFGELFCKTHSKDLKIAAMYHTECPLIASNEIEIVDPFNPDRILEENGHPVFSHRCDLFRAGECDRILEVVLAHYGRIDFLINAAAYSVWAPLISSGRTLDSSMMQFQMNSIVPLELSTKLVRRFWRDTPATNGDRNRHILNISSAAGTTLFRGHGQSVYAASKAALNVLTQHMAEEFKEFGIRVNALAPTSFPSLVSTSDVVAAAMRLDGTDATGQIVSVE
jgi:NAD(P)-dependent dehydrogenase (short-subunit alcohol dehydrogenase family)